ncbi:MAG: cytidine deaminase [Acidobacteriota bacterium]
MKELETSIQELIRIATDLAQPLSLEGECSSGTVAAALLTTAGNVYSGACIDLHCALGFCAERAAAAEMLKSRETSVKLMVAVQSDGEVVPPCGACREFLMQLDKRNGATEVILSNGQTRTIAQLLP